MAAAIPATSTDPTLSSSAQNLNEKSAEETNPKTEPAQSHSPTQCDSASNPKPNTSSDGASGTTEVKGDEAVKQEVALDDKEAATAETSAEDPSQQPSGSSEHKETFDSFYKEVKEIEQRDSVLTPKQQIDRLLRPGATYFNLNPYDVLDLPYDATMAEIKQKYRRMSILVHPDKNRDDAERAQKAFDSVNKAYKTLENEEGFKRCQEIVQEATTKTEELIAKKKKQLKKEGKEQVVPEEVDPEKFKHAVYVHMCKLFADLERLRIEKETREQHEKKRKAQEEVEEKEQAKLQKEWNKNFEESRTGRVDSWRSFNKAKGKKAKGAFRPPKPKLEKR